MPYLQPYLTDEEQQRIGASAPASASGGGSQVGTAPGGAKPSNGSGQFQAITSYFSPANAQGFADQVSGKIGAQAQDARSDMAQQASAYKAAGDKAVDDWSTSNSNSWNDWNTARDAAARAAIPENVKQTIGNWKPYQYTGTSVGYDQGPNGSGAKNAEYNNNANLKYDVDKANRYYGNAWAAYQPFQGTAAPSAPTWSPNTSKAHEVTQQVNALGSDEGRQGVLSQLYSQGGNYTAGMSRLDSALLGSGGAQQKAQQYGGLESELKATAAPGIKAASWSAPTATKRDPYNYDLIRQGLSGLGHT